MKNSNRDTIIHFEASNQEYAPVKASISEELEAVIRKVYQLDHKTGWALHYLTDIMLKHFHEDIVRVPYGDLTPIELALNSFPSRIEHTRMLLLKAGYEDKIGVGNPMWYLKLVLDDIERMKKLTKKEAKKNARTQSNTPRRYYLADCLFANTNPIMALTALQIRSR